MSVDEAVKFVCCAILLAIGAGIMLPTFIFVLDFMFKVFKV